MSTTPQTKVPALSRGEQRLAERMSLPDVEALVGDLAELHTRASAHDTAIRHRLDEISAEQDAVRARYQPSLDPLTAARDAALAERNAKLLRLQAWAEAHKATLFAPEKKRTLSFLRGVVGFRLSPPAVEIEAGRDPVAVAVVLKVFAWAKGFLKTPPPTLDKPALLAARKEIQADPIKRGLLADAGVRIVQRDEFYWEPRTEAPDSVKAAA